MIGITWRMFITSNENIEFICDYCSYKTTLKSSLILHNETCKIRLNKLNV